VLRLCGLRGQPLNAAEIAAAVRRRFPQADENLEADLKACEEAAWGETLTPREALKLIQKLNSHVEQLRTAAKSGAAFAKIHRVEPTHQERPS